MAPIQVDEDVILNMQAELLALKAMVMYSAQIIALVMAEQMSPKAFIESMRRSVTTLVRSDDLSNGNPSVEIIQTQAVTEVERIFDAITKLHMDAGSSKGH
jgi:hypothetical protein